MAVEEEKQAMSQDTPNVYLRWQGRGLRYFFISLLDWFDEVIVGHRIYAVCQFVGGHSWWQTREGAA